MAGSHCVVVVVAIGGNALVAAAGLVAVGCTTSNVDVGSPWSFAFLGMFRLAWGEMNSWGHHNSRGMHC